MTSSTLILCATAVLIWSAGFESVESSVHETVRRLKEHPLMPKDVRINGFIMDSATGELTRVEE